jgi:hypothetical protein
MSAMNTANLQLEGLLMAVAGINKLLVSKGLLTVEEIDRALRRAEAGLTGEERSAESLSPSNRDAICFPLRFLQLANNGQGDGGTQPFSELTRAVGQRKQPYNDQR